MGGPAQLLDLPELPSYARDVGPLPVAGPLDELGVVEVPVGVVGQGELERGVEAARAVLGGGDRTQCLGGRS